MNYYSKEWTDRVIEVEKHLTALKAIYGDFKTLNAYRGAERKAVRTLIDDLREERAELQSALVEDRILDRSHA